VQGVVDCSGDPAAFAELRVRTTAGALSATETGAGLVLPLDGNGDGTMILETTGGLSWGDVTLHAGVPGGAASGHLVLPLSDDNVRPVVIAQDPGGDASGMVAEVRLWFSEPLLASTVLPANFSVTGPAVTVVSEAVLGAGGADVVLTLDPPVGSGSAWTVTAASALRDEAGNRLSGDWSGAPAAYVGGFGGSFPVPEGLACTGFEPASLSMRPDGDPGAEEEADALSIAVSTLTAPGWWVLEVRDGDGGLVRHVRLPPAGPVDTVVWDGRDARGFVVPNGAYSVEVSPDDGLGNRGAGCARTVNVDNWLGGTP
jgi:hypothetical protein